MKHYLEEGPVSSGPRQKYEGAFLSFAYSRFPGCRGEEDLPYVVRSKIHHTFDVCRIGEYIMENDPLWKGCGKREKFIGYCTCLGHDLSRFEQYRDHRTLQDVHSFDHGEKSGDILEEGEFVFEELSGEDLQTVCRAVRMHNKKSIAENYPQDELLFAKLVRDADKLSILKVVLDFFRTPEGERSEDITFSVPDTPSCTEKVLEDALAGKGVNYGDIACVNDFKIAVFQWPADLNFASSAVYALENRLFEDFAGFLPAHPKMPLLTAKTEEYLKKLAGKDQ